MQCQSLASLDVSGWDVSGVTDMGSMFYNCSSLASLDVSGWHVSSVKNMGYMFAYCSSLASLDVSSWSSAKVNDVERMFYDCTSLRSLTFGAQWTKSLAMTELPWTLYGADGTAYTLAKVPLGVPATYYTRAEYVPRGDPAEANAATVAPTTPDAPTTGQGATADVPTTDRDSKSEADNAQDTGSKTGSSKGADSPAANGQDETPQAA